jgi:hypothetical protein
MLKVRVLATIDSSRNLPSKLRIRFQVPVFFPAFWQTQHFPPGHLYEHEGLAAFSNQGIVFRPSDPECAPKSHAIEPIKPAVDDESISKLGGAPIIDLGVHDNRVLLRLGHLDEGQTEFFGKQCARDFDEAQICDVRHNSTTIGIEKHHLHLCADVRRIWIHHSKTTMKNRKDAKLTIQAVCVVFGCFVVNIPISFAQDR